MGKIFYMMGKSASGKDTLYRRIADECRELEKIVLYTTRPMREGEKEGREYHFISEADLDQYERQGRIIEKRVYHTIAGPWIYATIDDGSIRLENKNYIGIGTLESYGKVREYFGSRCVEPIYIVVDDGIRLERALTRERQQRKPNYEELCRRYLADEADFAPDNLRKYGIDVFYQNIDLERCVEDITKKIKGIH